VDPVQPEYLLSKLRGARDAIVDSEAPIRDRLWSAYLSNLSSLDPIDFPDAAGRAEFESIHASLTALGEAIEDAGIVPTTLAFMEEADALRLAAKVTALYDRYAA
jgi:hypothetical protein